MKYLIISAALAIFSAFAFENLFNFWLVLVVVFFGLFCILTFIDAAMEGKNKMLHAGWLCLKHTAPAGIIWIFAIPLVLYVLVAIVGGIVTGPIWYLADKVNTTTAKRVGLVGIIVAIASVSAVGLLLFIKPILLYKYVHYAAVIAVSIGIAVVVIVDAIVFRYKDAFNKNTMWICILISLALIPLVAFGTASSSGQVYEIKSAQDMMALINAPGSRDIVFSLENDIDFEGENVSWYGKYGEFEGVFDGRGHTLSDIDCYVDMEPMNTIYSGFVQDNSGIIRNLNFKDCKFSYIVGEKERATIGLLAGYNSGKIYDCTIENCYMRYTASEKISLNSGYFYGSDVAGYSGIAVGVQSERSKDEKRIENVNVVQSALPDDGFYASDDETWYKISE